MDLWAANWFGAEVFCMLFNGDLTCLTHSCSYCDTPKKTLCGTKEMKHNNIDMQVGTANWNKINEFKFLPFEADWRLHLHKHEYILLLKETLICFTEIRMGELKAAFSWQRISYWSGSFWSTGVAVWEIRAKFPCCKNTPLTPTAFLSTDSHFHSGMGFDVCVKTHCQKLTPDQWKILRYILKY